MEVYAYTRSPRTTPESRRHQGYAYPGTGDPEGTIPTKWFSGPPKEIINEFLSVDLDAVVVAMPLDESTNKLFGKEQFDIMGSTPRRTFFINIARGGIVDQPALVEALEKGVIRGAALDVTNPEPLPAGDPLWKAPNVFITPHMSWQSTGLHGRVVDKLWRNLERLHKGEPLMDKVNNR
jgi:phosphoglycerate dehydrogenase-like enzyme